MRVAATYGNNLQIDRFCPERDLLIIFRQHRMAEHEPNPLSSVEGTFVASARSRADACRKMAAMEFSPRTRRYFEERALEWDQVAEELASRARNLP
jgi:hypothetical protein